MLVCAFATIWLWMCYDLPMQWYVSCMHVYFMCLWMQLCKCMLVCLVVCLYDISINIHICMCMYSFNSIQITSQVSYNPHRQSSLNIVIRLDSFLLNIKKLIYNFDLMNLPLKISRVRPHKVLYHWAPTFLECFAVGVCLKDTFNWFDVSHIDSLISRYYYKTKISVLWK